MKTDLLTIGTYILQDIGHKHIFSLKDSISWPIKFDERNDQQTTQDRKQKVKYHAVTLHHGLSQ